MGSCYNCRWGRFRGQSELKSHLGHLHELSNSNRSVIAVGFAPALALLTFDLAEPLGDSVSFAPIFRFQWLIENKPLHGG